MLGKLDLAKIFFAGVRKATGHSVVKEPRPLETSANGDSDIEESEEEKNLGTRQVKRTISLDEEESTRPARRPVSTLAVPQHANLNRQKKNSKHAEMEKTADKVGWYFLSSPVTINLELVGARPQVHQRRRQTSDKTGSDYDRDGLHCFCLWFYEFVCAMVHCAVFSARVPVEFFSFEAFVEIVACCNMFFTQDLMYAMPYNTLHSRKSAIQDVGTVDTLSMPSSSVKQKKKSA
ncbi:hypothetical protein EDD22DRAFT_464095 [Suillus occidentalis]|nr:hypothetical protein EDD22DRAFT_464095 [Suillus occidentalis]